MFGRKKKDLPAGARMMHYEGLRGFSQDGPCFMERTEAGLVFRQANGPAATLPLEKVTGLEMMPERNFMARYHGTAATTAYGKAVKWFAVFHYTTQEGERMLAHSGVYVCSVCGFVYVGDAPPELCPVCKVPAWKFDAF